MTAWEELDDVSKSIADEPWSPYWRELKSGTAEFERFPSRSPLLPGKVV